MPSPTTRRVSANKKLVSRVLKYLSTHTIATESFCRILRDANCEISKFAEFAKCAVVTRCFDVRKLPPRPYKGLRLLIDAIPRTNEQRPANETIDILRSGEVMCGGDIDQQYLTDAAMSRGSWSWTMKNKDGVVHGFAIVQPPEGQPNALHLTLICSNRGEGLTLFQNILRWGQAKGKDYLELEAVSKPVADAYRYAAKKIGLVALPGLGGGRRLSPRLNATGRTDFPVDPETELIPMTIPFPSRRTGV